MNGCDAAGQRVRLRSRRGDENPAEGPCAGPVKDSQRSKTAPETTRTLSLVWGSVALPGRAERTASWYRELLQSLGATTTPL